MIAATVVIQIALPGGTRKKTFTKTISIFVYVVYLFSIITNFLKFEAPKLKKIP